MRRSLRHPLAGADLWTLGRLYLGSGGVARESRMRAAFAALSALGRAPFTVLDQAIGPFSWGRTPISRPIFILGHWRSGTTHLYNIMAKDPQFAFVPPVDTGMPWETTTLARWLQGPIAKTLPPDRFIDAIPVHGDSPQEDETAIANMTTLSFFHGIYFPHRFDAWIDRGVFMDGASAGLRAQWRRAARRFFKKIIATQGGRRLLIKNPVYTARAGVLRAMFPDARFIHIRRNPYEVFASMRNFYAKLLQEMALQDFAEVDVDGVILRTYARMMRVYERDAAALPPDALAEIEYERLDRDPIDAVRFIYDQLEIDGFEAARPAFETYLASVKSFAKNRFAYSDEAATKVEAHWGEWVRRWGYERPDAKAA